MSHGRPSADFSTVTTVMHAHKKIQGLIKKDAAAEALLQSLTVQIRGI